MTATKTPRPPAELSKDARKEWKRIVPELQRQGLYSTLDRSVLIAYCVAYGRWVEAERELKETGLTQLSPNGYRQKSPALTISDKALAQMRQFIIQLGLSPASRSKIVNRDVQDDAEDARFFG